MFRKKNEEEKINLEDVFYLVSLIAEKAGIDFDEENEDEVETKEKIEKNAIVDTDKFFKEELKEGDHNESIKENEGVDKNHIEEEIIAIALKPDDNFMGGKEEKDATLRKLITKGFYSPSTRSEKDNACDEKENEDKEEEEIKQRATGDDELKKDIEKRPIFNSIMGSIRQPVKQGYLTRNERIAQNNKKYSINK